MNQKEVSEIRRRFRQDRSNIARIYGCYVNSAREIIARIDTSLGLMSQDEQEMYLGLLKKSLSGALRKNLIDIEFSVKQVMEGPEHKLLQTLRSSELEDEAAREALYKKIIASVTVEENGYVILLGQDSYDVPFKNHDGAPQEDGEQVVFKYFICAVCPVKDASVALRYIADERQFHGVSTGQTVAPPVLGFMFPAFDDRAANIYNALYYCKDPDDVHQEFIDAVFRTEPPMSAGEQRDAFRASVSGALEKDCSFEVMQAVHEQVRERILVHKESKDPEPLTLSIREAGEILRDSGADNKQVEAFQTACTNQFGENAALEPINIIESKKFQVSTPQVKITVDPEWSYMIETKVIGGRRYILVPADEGVEINGMAVNIPGTANSQPAPEQ